MVGNGRETTFFSVMAGSKLCILLHLDLRYNKILYDRLTFYDRSRYPNGIFCIPAKR